MHRFPVRLTIVAIVLILAGSPANAQFSGLPLQEGVPFDATVFAEGVNFPVGMVVLPDGSLLVGSSNPTGGSYFSSTGELLRFLAVDGNALSGGAGDVVMTGLAGMVTAVAVERDLVFVTSVESGLERIQVLRASPDWSGPYELLGEIAFDFRGFGHQSYGLATRPSPGLANGIELYFNVGASGNDTSGKSVPVSGLLQTALPDASLYRTTVTERDGELLLTEPEQIATGLRNAMAFGFHSQTGDLWITDNGIDGFEDVWVSYSADELNVIPVAQIGGEVEDFGFPSSYTLYASGEEIGNRGIQPVVAFLPIGGAENEGISSMVFTPPPVTAVLGDGVLVGFHGQYDMWGEQNEENALLFVNVETFDVATMVAPGLPGVGHLDSMAANDESIFVADMCVGDSLAHATPCGVIYRLSVPGS